MRTETEQDAYFLTMLSIICKKHDIEFDAASMVDMETRTIMFPRTNVDLQLIDDIDRLFSIYSAN